MPLFELVETLISASLVCNDQVFDLPYIQAFQELVIELQRRESKGISDFLHFWEQKGSQKGIQVSENSNAIRILTIHRSKGLEFKAVIDSFLQLGNYHRSAKVEYICGVKQRVLPSAGFPLYL